jgi:hypothetical protein
MAGQVCRCRAVNEDVELGVVRLSDLVWAVGAAAKDKFMPVPVGRGTFGSQGYQGRVPCMKDFADEGVARRQGASRSVSCRLPSFSTIKMRGSCPASSRSKAQRAVDRCRLSR